MKYRNRKQVAKNDIRLLTFCCGYCYAKGSNVFLIKITSF